jgi:hypothetical protein
MLGTDHRIRPEHVGLARSGDAPRSDAPYGVTNRCGHHTRSPSCRMGENASRSDRGRAQSVDTARDHGHYWDIEEDEDQDEHGDYTRNHLENMMGTEVWDTSGDIDDHPKIPVS